MSNLSTSDCWRRKAIEGRPFTCSKATNTFLPALKLGWPHDAVSLAAGYLRHSARSLSMVDAAFFATSERRDRIERRTGATWNRQRRRGQQELPPFAGCGRLCERFQIAVVEQVDAEIDERKVMDRAARRAGRSWRHVLRMIAS